MFSTMSQKKNFYRVKIICPKKGATMDSLYCGIDYHKNTCTICLLDDNGKFSETSTVKTTNVIKYLSNKDLKEIAIEASGGVNEFVDRLKSCGHKVKIVNPSAFRLIGFNGKKTDKKDAQALAEGLKGDYLPTVHHKSKSSREIKSLLIGRETIVRSRVNLSNSIRGMLREQGITIPAGKDKFIKEIRGKINLIKHEQIKKLIINQVELFFILLQQETVAEELLDELTQNIGEIELLKNIPGVGSLTALAIIAVADDISRFDSGKNFASYLGLVPRESSSGGKRRLGSITRSGSEILRRYLIHGARSVIMHSCRYNNKVSDPNKLWALRLKDKVGMNKATVALAHRMSRIIFAILRDGSVYEEKTFARSA